MTDAQSQAQIEKALASGLDIVALAGLFAYFLYHTPEGEKLRSEIKADWEKVTLNLREEKILKGRHYTFTQFLNLVVRELDKNTDEIKMESKVKTTVKKRLRTQKEPKQKFKGV